MSKPRAWNLFCEKVTSQSRQKPWPDQWVIGSASGEARDPIETRLHGATTQKTVTFISRTFQVLATVKMKMLLVFWVVMPCVYRHFGRTYFLHKPRRRRQHFPPKRRIYLQVHMALQPRRPTSTFQGEFKPQTCL
jgi:hypothetical protein